MKNRIIISFGIVLIVILSLLTVFSAGEKNTVVSDRVFLNDIIDRVKIESGPTKFIRTEGSEEYVFSFPLKISKTEADFYGKINSVTFENIRYSSVYFYADSSNSYGGSLDGLILSAENSEPIVYSYNVVVTCKSLPDNASLILNLTTGFSKLASDMFEIEIPLEFEIATSTDAF